MPKLKQPTLQEFLTSIQESGIEIISRIDNLWKVRISFPKPAATQEELLKRLRVAKILISREFGVPISLLEFRELVEKTPTSGGINTVVIVGRREVPQGRPEVRLLSIETPRGEILTDMIAEIDFSYLDEFEHPIDLERLDVELKRHDIDWTKCDLEKIESAIRQVHESQGTVEHLEVIRGEMPEMGEDAELEYAFFTDPTLADNLGEFRNGRRVHEKDILCQKIPPRSGKRSGRDVHGEVIPPIKGHDFELIADEGAKLSADGMSVKALRDGVPYMKRTNKKIYTLAGEKVVLDKIEVGVKPVISLRGDESSDIILEEPVEVSGDLKGGCTISTEGEIFVDGGLEKGAKVRARENVIISGQIRGGEISSDRAIFANDDVCDAKIVAGDEVNILGLVQNSEISGFNVKASHIAGSQVVAGCKISLQSAGNGPDGQKTKIRVGRNDFYERQIEENRKTVKEMEQILKRIRKIFGEEVFGQLQQGNLHRLLMQHLRKIATNGQADLDNATIESLRKLLETVNPMKDIMSEKREEMEYLLQKATEESSHRPIVVIREKIQGDVDITIHGKAETIGAKEGGTAITTSESGEIQSYPLKPPSKRRAARRKGPGPTVKKRLKK